jgi:hypothetical protein
LHWNVGVHQPEDYSDNYQDDDHSYNWHVIDFLICYL